MHLLLGKKPEVQLTPKDSFLGEKSFQPIQYPNK